VGLGCDLRAAGAMGVMDFAVMLDGGEVAGFAMSQSAALEQRLDNASRLRTSN
jgi:hypothetical protein